MSERKFIIGKPYSVAQVKAIMGDDFFEKRQRSGRAVATKPRIRSFAEFDPETKEIYLKIYEEVKKMNPGYPRVRVWATGSRITGTWRTKEESDALAEARNVKPKYSDYDYFTDMPRFPNKQRLFMLTGVDCDLVGSPIKVLVVPPGAVLQDDEQQEEQQTDPSVPAPSEES